MEVQKPREAPIKSTVATHRSPSAKKGTSSKSPERSRPRKVGEGATKSPEEREGSPGIMRAGPQLPASKGRSSRVTEERSPGFKNDKRSATATPTSALLRGSPPPTGTAKSPSTKAGSSRTAKKDNVRSLGKDGSRDAPVASLSQTGAQGPAPTSFVTAPSKKFGKEDGVSRSPSRTRSPTAATSSPRSTAGGTPKLRTAATELLHSKSRSTERSKSRGRGLSTEPPRSASSKQGAQSCRGPQATRATSRSTRGNHKSRDVKPTSTSPRRSVVGKGRVAGGASGSHGTKLASSTPARKDR